MSKFFQWIIGISVVVLVLAIAANLLAPLFVPSLRGTATMPHASMMESGGHMMMDGGRGGMTPALAPGASVGRGFGLPFFNFGRLLFPVLFIGAIVWGVTWLVRAVRPAPQAPIATTPCAHCSQPLQAGWKACPYCGEKVQ